jgi:hypothetical protein
MVISNYSMPDSSKLSQASSNASSRQTTKRVEKPKKEAPKEEKKEEKLDENDKHIISEKEFQEQQYQKMVKEQKLKEVLEEKKYKDIAVRIAPEENIFCLAVDGSQTSKDAFEIILKEFLNRIHDSVLICPHIYNNLHDEKFNWRFQKAHVMEYFKTRLITSIADHQGYLIIQDRDTYKVHEIEQAYKISEVNEAKYFFCGYEGLREQALKPSRIDVGLEYLLTESKVPVFVMKDKNMRGVKNQGYKWLLLMDRSNSDCLKVLDLFLPLIDRDIDRIYGLTLMPPFVSYDDIKAPFYEKMKELNFFEGEQFEYLSIEYKSNPVPILTEFVNHNHEHYFDFVIFLNNPQKCQAQKKDSHTFKYIKLLFANIGFCNYAYLDGYDYKVISKLPTEVDDRKYLNKFNKLDLDTIKASIGMEKGGDFNDVNLGKEDVIHSEIYGVDNGHVYEKSNQSEATTIKTEAKKKPEPKKTNVANNKKNTKTNTKTNTTANKNVKGKTGKK